MKLIFFILLSFNALFSQDDLNELNAVKDEMSIMDYLTFGEIEIKDAKRKGNEVEKFLQKTEVFLDTLEKDKDFRKCVEIEQLQKHTLEKKEIAKKFLDMKKISQHKYDNYVKDLNKMLNEFDTYNAKCEKYKNL